MSQPVPEVEKKPSIFPVPAHIHSVLIGGGCGVSHVPQNGAVDCEACFPYAQSFIYPPGPAEVEAEAKPVIDVVDDAAPAKARKTPPQPAE